MHWNAGERCDTSVLTADEVQQIRRRYAEGTLSHADLANEYLVSRTTIYHIVNRITWKHLPALTDHKEQSRAPT